MGNNTMYLKGVVVGGDGISVEVCVFAFQALIPPKQFLAFWGFRMDTRGLRFHTLKNIGGCLDDLAFDD